MTIPPACCQSDTSLTETSWFNPTASTFFQNVSRGSLPACFRSLTKFPWVNPTASEFFLNWPPGFGTSANGNLVV